MSSRGQSIWCCPSKSGRESTSPQRTKLNSDSNEGEGKLSAFQLPAALAVRNSFPALFAICLQVAAYQQHVAKC